jgi:hypothetical protein
MICCVSHAGLSIYGNLLIESVSSVFHFRRVSFFNGIKKKIISVLKAIFVGCRFLTVSKKNFISVLKVRGAFPDHQMSNDVPLPFTAFLLDRWRPLSLLRSVLAKLEFARRPSRQNTPYNMDFPLQPATRCLLKLLMSAANFAYALVAKALLKNR